MVGQDVLNMAVYDGMGSFQCVFRGGRGQCSRKAIDCFLTLPVITCQGCPFVLYDQSFSFSFFVGGCVRIDDIFKDEQILI